MPRASPRLPSCSALDMDACVSIECPSGQPGACGAARSLGAELFGHACSMAKDNFFGRVSRGDFQIVTVNKTDRVGEWLNKLLLIISLLYY